MPRLLDDWLEAYVTYASVTEAPRRMHFWSGVSAIAGTLRRKTWIDMKRFIWYPSFYIIFVAPPGIVAKSTTADIAMDILRDVPGIKFGPDIVTWQSLATSFAGASEAFKYIDPETGEELFHPMSAMTLVASELGNLINPQDRDMINLYINLWDGRKKLDKQTKMSGNDLVEAPYINMIGCTTPHWIADNMPTAIVGGGFTSRCIFVYAEKKEKYVALVDESVSSKDHVLRAALLQDLTYISERLVGPFTITEPARVWMRSWYETYWNSTVERLDSTIVEGYAARKQTHMFKLAMILSASRSDSRTIDAQDIQLANVMLEDIEPDMEKVFARIGKTEQAIQAERFIGFVQRRGAISYEEAYRFIHSHFPDVRDFEGIVSGAVRSGYIEMKQGANGFVLTAKGPSIDPSTIITK